MNKSDVPFIGQPVSYRIGIYFIAIGYVLLLVWVPDVRPGVLELILGVVSGIASGVLLAKAWLKYLIHLSEEVREKPWLNWATTFAYPLPPLGSHIAYRALIIVLMFASFLGISWILQVFSRLFPNLGWPWTRYGLQHGVDSYKSIPPTMIIYIIVTIASIIRKGMSWYRSLPD